MSDRVIRLMCPNLKCKRVLAVPERARGKNVKCMGCGAFVKVPASAAPTPAPDPAPADAAQSSS